MTRCRRGAAFAVLATVLAANGLWAGDRPFPYELKKSDFWLGGGGAGLAGLGALLHAGQGKITLEEVLALDRNDVNAFDRPATRNWSSAWAGRSDVARDVTVISSLLVSAAPALLRAEWSRALTVSVMFAEAYAVMGGVTYLTKTAVARKRPYLYNTGLTPEERLEALDDPKASFFSGHAAAAFAAAAFLSKVFTDIHGPSAWSTLVWASSLSLAAYTGFARVKAGVHFPSDAIAGAAVGFAIGYLVPVLHKKGSSGRPRVAVGPNTVSLSLGF
ncbi:MAG TPA: phosphatase PAP2 family protein [Candidatus Aminicenantes bacterium]|nr:phosphatase PAP2 family protein [Candidatus Aminicenantes bacterium]